MKKIIGLLSVVILTLVILFSNEIKQAIKAAAVGTYKQVAFWNNKLYPLSVKTHFEEKLLIYNQLVAYTNKLVFSYGEQILLHFISENDLEVSIFQINKNGKKLRAVS